MRAQGPAAIWGNLSRALGFLTTKNVPERPCRKPLAELFATHSATREVHVASNAYCRVILADWLSVARSRSSGILILASRLAARKGATAPCGGISP
jgi:hypothetical protein